MFRNTFLAMFLAVAMGASNAFALSMVSYSASVPLQPTDFFAQVPVPPIPEFNGPGTLMKVVVEAEGTLVGDVTITNNETVPQIVNNADLGALLNVIGPASLILNPNPLLDVVDGLFGPAPFILAPNGGQIVASTPQGGVTATAMDMAPGGSGNFGLGDFIGGGFVNFSVDGIGTFGFDGSSNLDIAFNTDAAAEVTVTYFFEDGPPPEVPEPMTAGLLSLAGLGLLRRRR